MKPRCDFNKGRSECRACSALIAKAYRVSENGIAVEKAYRKRDYHKAKVSAWLKSDHGRKRRKLTEVARRYGVTPEAYDAMFASQGGTCAVCRLPPKHRSLCVDHNHQTGEVRGLVCIGCNLLIAQIERNDEVALRAREYISDPPARLVLGPHRMAS